jgi:IS5 family transposase
VKSAPVKGYKAHVATDELGGVVRRVVVTVANVHDAKGAVGLLGRRPGRVWADSAYDSSPLKERIRRCGGTAMIHPVRCRIEKVFGTSKRSYGLERARYMGRRRVSLQVHLTLIAHNLRRAVSLTRPSTA